jgi:3-methyladenine DNA glycosylase AlkD
LAVSGKIQSETNQLSRSTESNEAVKLEAAIVSRIASLAGHDTETIRAVRREFSKRIVKLPAALVIELAIKLIDRSEVPRFVGYELIQNHKAAALSLAAKQIDRLGSGIDSWGAVDTFACYIAGPAWRERQIPDKLIKRWARSKDRWWRRAALVSTVPLNSKARGGNGDPARTIAICQMLTNDRDDMVVKAMSWALRELAKRDARSVRDFLKEHRTEIAPRVVREVQNKLRTGLKNPRRS